MEYEKGAAKDFCQSKKDMIKIVLENYKQGKDKIFV